MCVCLLACLFVCLFVCLFAWFFVCLFALRVYLIVRLFGGHFALLPKKPIRCRANQNNSVCTTFHSLIYSEFVIVHEAEGGTNIALRNCLYLLYFKRSENRNYCLHGDSCDFQLKFEMTKFCISFPIRCNNGQRLDRHKVCDQVMHCLDGSDEQYCVRKEHKYTGRFYRQQPPVIIHMDGRGSFTGVAMTADDPCPETHFRCHGEQVYCMPVYLRCNQVKDCPNGEDELQCDVAVCPGYYRCRGSTVCLHPSHVCDGWPQCPQRDDELLCNATCPAVCQCQGLAFVCRRSFPAADYPELRYLDATGSSIIPENIPDNLYLIYLSFASCELDSWPVLHLRNLQSLDLSHNNISIFSLEDVCSLSSLKYLTLKSNPIKELVRGNSNVKQISLLQIDLSFTHIWKFDSKVFINFQSVMDLNLSYSSLKSVRESGFLYLPKLRRLDISGCRVEKYPRDLFRGLTDLQFVKAENYKMCCKVILPKSFNERFCIAPQDEISSCDDLLRSNFYRSFLWLVGITSLLGNAGCFLLRVIGQRSRLLKSGYNTFVTNLSLSDFLMGVYLVIIGTADELYRGRYLWHEQDWKGNTMCTLAGFISLLSNEVSAFMICLITVGRFLVLHFPFSEFHFKGRSAIIASGLAWLSGLLLAAVPLFSVFSHWRFYGHTGICIPLPVTKRTFEGKGYSFGVMIVFNFILFVSIALGQASIYWAIKTNSVGAVTSTNTSRDLTVARRLITVVVSDFLCWFPIGVLGLMANSGTPVPGEVNVAMAIFVLPLNSALNPFLYTFNMLMEKRRKAREARLLECLQKSVEAQLMEEGKSLRKAPGEETVQ